EPKDTAAKVQGPPSAATPDHLRAGTPVAGPVLAYFHPLTAQPDVVQVPERRRPWTFLVYGAVDNSADEALVKFLDKVGRAIDNDPGIELLLFIDRSKQHKKTPTYLGEDFTATRLYRLTRDTAERLSGGPQIPEITLARDVELNSADARYVQQFIAWGKA